jgi:Flp pilus assembly protein TadD
MQSKMTWAGALALAALLAALAGCQRQEGPAETAGKTIDKAVEKSGEKIDETQQKLGEKIEKAGENLQDAAKREPKN